jgi:hypothetical protein
MIANISLLKPEEPANPFQDRTRETNNCLPIANSNIRIVGNTEA